MRYMSLFSGIGGFELGLQRVFDDTECVGFSEIHAPAKKVYQQHFPDHPDLGDVRGIKWDVETQGAVDLIVGGPPCQDLSVALRFNSKKKDAEQKLGLEGERSSLFYEFLRLCRESGARYVIMENVATMRGEECAKITEELRGVFGRNLTCTFINSANFSAQARRRYFWTNFPIDDANTGSPTLAQVLLPLAEVRDLELSDKAKAYMDRAVKGGRTHWNMSLHSDTANPKARAVTRAWHKGTPYTVLCDARDGTVVKRHFHPIEAERLQTFPDGWTGALSKTQRFFTLGNAVTVAVIEHIARALRDCQKNERAPKKQKK